MRGCKWPDETLVPIASKLRGANSMVFHSPLFIISSVRSTTSSKIIPTTSLIEEPVSSSATTKPATTKTATTEPAIRSTFNLKNFERSQDRIKDSRSQILSEYPKVQLSKKVSGLTEYSSRAVYIYYIDNEINIRDNTYNENQMLTHSTIIFKPNFNNRIEEKDKYKLIFSDTNNLNLI